MVLVKRLLRGIRAGAVDSDVSPRVCDLEVHLGKLDSTPLEKFYVQFDAEGIHTIRWDDPITCEVSRLPRWLTEWDAVRLDTHIARTGKATLAGNGSCNLGAFPRIMYASGEERLASPSELCVLVAIILDLTFMKLPAQGADMLRRDRERRPELVKDVEYVMDVVDITGENPIHALQLASKRPAGSAALQLVYTLMTINPKLVMQRHHAGNGSGQAFKGENCMHIAAVNGQERLLLAMINLSSHLSKRERNVVFGSKVEGAFFTEQPQCYYGGSVLSFAVVHGMKKAVIVLAGAQKNYTGGLNANYGIDSSAKKKSDYYCSITGFLPIHAAVACNNIEMAEFLTRDLLDDSGESLTFGLRAAAHQPTILPSIAGESGLGQLTPLQLAAKLGKIDMFRHLLKYHHTLILWEWGERRKYKIDLTEIDAVGENSDVLNLVCRPDALSETAGIISDDFMNGFIWRIFKQKWDRYGLLTHVVLTLIAVTKLALLIYVVFGLKQMIGAPLSNEQRNSFVSASVIALIAAVVQLMFEIAYIATYTTGRNDLANGARWVLAVQMLGKSYITILAALLGICGNVTLFVNLGVGRSAQNGGDYGLAMGEFDDNDGAAGSLNQLLWTFYSLAIFFQAIEVNEAVTSIFEQQGVFFLTVVNMLKHDILTFLPVFVIYIVIFWLTLYALYPVTTQNVAEFNSLSPITTLNSMFMLALTGELFDVEIYDDFGRPTWNASPAVAFNFWLFYLTYIGFILLTVILLLNLLIARMNSTYTKIEEEATVQWRIMFARRVIRLENFLITKFLSGVRSMCYGTVSYTRAGTHDPKTGRFFFEETVLIKDNGQGTRIDPAFFGIPSETEEGKSSLQKNQNQNKLPELSTTRSAQSSSNVFEDAAGEDGQPRYSLVPPNLFRLLKPGCWSKRDYDYDGQSDKIWLDERLDEYFPLDFGVNNGWTDGQEGKGQGHKFTSRFYDDRSHLADPQNGGAAGAMLLEGPAPPRMLMPPSSSAEQDDPEPRFFETTGLEGATRPYPQLPFVATQPLQSGLHRVPPPMVPSSRARLEPLNAHGASQPQPPQQPVQPSQQQFMIAGQPYVRNQLRLVPASQLYQ